MLLAKEENKKKTKMEIALMIARKDVKDAFSKKNVGRPKNSVKIVTSERVMLNEKIISTKDIRKRWDKYTDWCIINDYNLFPRLFDNYLLLFYNNLNYSGVAFGEVNDLLDESEIYKLKKELPHVSGNLPKGLLNLKHLFLVFRDIICKNQKIKLFLKEKNDFCLVVQKNIKKGCGNVFCGGKCDFVWRYLIFYHYGEDKFKILIQVKGGHTENFKAYVPCYNELPVSVATKWKIREDDFKFKKDLNGFRGDLEECSNNLTFATNILSKKQIYNRRYQISKSKYNTFENSCQEVVKRIEEGEFPYFNVYQFDINEKYLSIIVLPDEHLKKDIEVVYFDGTFKTKYLRGLNVPILYFCTLNKNNDIIPLGKFLFV